MDLLQLAEGDRVEMISTGHPGVVVSADAAKVWIRLDVMPQSTWPVRRSDVKPLVKGAV